MNSIEKYLNKQREGFISLHDLISRASKANEASYEDTATVLHHLLSNPNIRNRPQWIIRQSKKPNRKATAEEQTQGILMLSQASDSGTPDEIPF